MKRDYEDELIEKLDLKKLHFNQSQCHQFTAFQCQDTKRYLSNRRFDEFPWLVWKTSVNGLDTELQSDQSSNPGKAFCDICTNAQECGFHIDANQSKFVGGMHDWCHGGSAEHLQNHQNHQCHIEAITFLFNHFQPATLIDQLNVQAIQILQIYKNLISTTLHLSYIQCISWEEMVIHSLVIHLKKAGMCPA
jgi:hypothetical protein